MHRHTCDLSLTGRLLIWSWRHAARAQRQRRDLPQFVLHTLNQLPGGTRVAALAETLFAHVILGARRPLRFACPDQPLLTRDEATLIEALLAAAFDFHDEARLILAELQHAGGLRRSTQACCELAQTLRDRKLPLSGRSTPVTLNSWTCPTPQPIAASRGS